MMRHLTTSLAILFLCAACGAKGPLERPAGPAPAPWFGSGKAKPVDVSTPEKAQE